MHDLIFFEEKLRKIVDLMIAAPCPPRLAQAIEYAVFGGGNRLRPRLLLAVARTCKKTDDSLCLYGAAAIELIHSASLVHDDLPAFDNAEMRRNAPSVHAKYGQAIGVLVGDALLVGGFTALSLASKEFPQKAGELIRMLTQATGCPSGIIAGQAWEEEESVAVEEYHRSKTASLFEWAAMAGALCAGEDPESYRGLGRYVGMAYQIADDLRDELGDPSDLGKPSGKDKELNRPSIVKEMGVDSAMQLFESTLEKAIHSVPACKSHEELTSFVDELLARFRTALSGKAG